MDKDMTSLFPEDIELPLPTDHHQHWPSSSSSSFRSLSTGQSPEYSSLLMSTMMASSTPGIEQAIRPTSTTITQDQQQTMQAYNNYLGIEFLNPESDEAVMTRAMLAVISSPPSWPSSTSSSYQPQRTPSAFKKYIMSAALAPRNVQTRPRQNMLKHVISILKNLYQRRIEEQTQASRSTTTSQLHHKMSERKRREKLNQTFVQLRSLLPPGTKKDKASVLSSTRDYLTSLKDEVLELKQKNNLLEARLSNRKEVAQEASISASNEPIQIKITQASESNSEEREMNLQVTVRGDCCMVDLVIRLLEFLKQVKNVRLLFMEADTESQQASLLNRISLRMKIEEGELDELALKGAIERVIADVTP